MVQDYTENGMGHVDSFNSHLQRLDRKHKNFTRRRTFFCSMIRIVEVNSWIYHDFQHNTIDKTLNRISHNYSQEEFLQILKKSLATPYIERSNILKEIKVIKRKERRAKKENSKYKKTSNRKNSLERDNFLNNLLDKMKSKESN